MKPLPHENWPLWLRILDGIALLLTAIIAVVVLFAVGRIVVPVVAPPLVAVALAYASYEFARWVVRLFTRTCPRHHEKILRGFVDLDNHQAMMVGLRDILFSEYRQNGFQLDSDLYRQFPWSGVRDFSSSGKHRVRYCPTCRNGWNALVRESITAFHGKQLRERSDGILPEYRQNVEKNVQKQIAEAEEILLLPSVIPGHAARMTDG